jgi:hypothetical protein
LSRCRRRSKCASAKLAKTSRCSIRTSKSSTDSFDVLLPLFVVEVLDAPFCRFTVSLFPIYEIIILYLPGTASRSSSLANFMTAAHSPTIRGL